MLKSGRSSVGIYSQLLALSCFGLLLAGGISGCGGNSDQSSQEAKQAAPLEMQVRQVDQLNRLDTKQADGQYLVTRLAIKNVSNQPINLDPASFTLQFMAKDEKQQYTQSYEKDIDGEFGVVYGDANKDKLMLSPLDINPRIELERYFVFMVPSDATADQYQIVYTDPANEANKITVPLVTPGATVVNDHRSEPTSSTSPPAEQ